MKIKEEIKSINQKSDKELSKELGESYNKLQKLQFSKAFGKIKDATEIKKVKHHIARVWTAIRQNMNQKQETK